MSDDEIAELDIDLGAMHERCPDIVDSALESRQSLIRAVRFPAAEDGVRQFLDIGTGLPTMQNTHAIIRRIVDGVPSGSRLTLRTESIDGCGAVAREP